MTEGYLEMLNVTHISEGSAIHIDTTTTWTFDGEGGRVVGVKIGRVDARKRGTKHLSIT